jgi:hypothetical protein
MTPATITRYLSPADVAERYGCKASKVILWILAGELRAVNAAANRNGRKPRWKISPADLAAFEASRSCQPEAKPAPRRRKLENVTEYF